MALFTPRLRIAAKDFDPGGITVDNGNVYGLPGSADDASLILLPVPWEVTVSYRQGTAAGPEILRSASLQVDLYDEAGEDAWQYGIYMPPQPVDIFRENLLLRARAAKLLACLSQGDSAERFSAEYADINRACALLHDRLEAQALACLERGQIVGTVGGDHSVSLGPLRAYARHVPAFGILHVDAHADLRQAYEGFFHSHASIMHNALALPQVSRIVQVGIRDFCREEHDLVEQSSGRLQLFTDAGLKAALFRGRTWDMLCDDIVASLPDLVYVSFDIDGLDPALCPATGTPVPGGLSYGEAVHLLKKVTDSGRKVIGFDLVEVAGGEDSWDSIVGARLLYTLCSRAILSCKE